MSTDEAGHLESQTSWPDPLGGGLWNVGTLALPATMLSSSSALVLGGAFVFLQFFGSEQELFVVPSPWTFAIGAVAATIAWTIVHVCRTRPGRLWPRLWALALATLDTIVAGLGLAFPSHSALLALAVSGLAASVVLIPRLVKLRPNSAMVQRVAPISAFLALMIIPSSCAIRHAIATKTEQRVDDRIRQLQRLALQVRETSSFDWSRMEDSPDAASRAVETLRGLSVPTSKGENELWRSAASLHKDDELVAAMDGVTEEVVGAFNPERVPRVSTLREPALRWEHPSRRWIPYSQFPVLSEIAGTYHQELGRLFAELAPQSIGRDQPAAVEYQRHYQQRRELLRSYLNDTAGSWTDNWAAFRVPHHDELIGRNDAPLREVLQAPFVSGPYGKLSSGQFFRLMSLPLSTAKSITGCDEGARPAHAPGCHCHDYAEGSFSYFRVDCYSYVPRKEATGADLRVELRLVYQSRYRKGLLANELPNELFFHFLLPPGAEESAFREEVMTALSTAARVFQPRAIQRSKDRSGSVASGFTLRQKGETLDIVSKLVPLQGLVPERKALLVRVFRPGFGSAL